MYNPFIPFDEALLRALLKRGHSHFVRQTYERGRLPGASKKAFLLTHYADPNKARIHYEAIENDPARFLYDTNEPDHLERLHRAAAGIPGFAVYAPIMMGNWKPTSDIGARLRHYVTQHLRWRLGRSSELKSHIFVQFGQIFLTLRYGSEEAKIPFSDIET
jgi:hypothetical protein